MINEWYDVVKGGVVVKKHRPWDKIVDPGERKLIQASVESPALRDVAAVVAKAEPHEREALMDVGGAGVKLTPDVVEVER